MQIDIKHFGLYKTKYPQGHLSPLWVFSMVRVTGLESELMLFVSAGSLKQTPVSCGLWAVFFQYLFANLATYK